MITMDDSMHVSTVALGERSQKTVRLIDLIDMLIQKSYHDLVVLAEVELSRKNDFDRKIAIMQYLSRTRNYFIRFLALFKWSSSMPKVSKCFEIIEYLEQQSAFFVETADVLARMARETLANSKLPCYQVSFAVDVLNSRTCPRLPSCIKDKIVPPDPLSTTETEETLRELEYALLYRLVTSDRPPAEMRHFVIKRGRVCFTVEREFDVALTVMGDDKSMPFRVLDLNILVKHRRVGDGRALVHPQQIAYLKQLVQSRIMDCEKPLDEVYEVLHSFCQGLQLEVIFTQLSKHMTDGRLDYYRIEGYKAGRELKIFYWHEAAKKDVAKAHSMTISLGPEKDFVVQHQPLLTMENNLGNLDISAFMMSVIHHRVKGRIQKLESELSRYYQCSSEGFPLVLNVALYSGSPRSQKVSISIDYYTGVFSVNLSLFKPTQLLPVRDYLNSSNSETERLVELLKQVHLDLLICLAKRMAADMSLQDCSRVGIFGGEAFEQYSSLGPSKALFRFQKKIEVTALLAVSAHDDATQPEGTRVDFHVIVVESAGMGLRVVGIMSHDDLLEESISREPQLPLKQPTSRTPLELLKARLQSMKEYRGGAPAKPQQRFQPASLASFYEIAGNMLTHITFLELRSSLKGRGFAAETTLVHIPDGTSSLPLRVSHPLVRSCTFRLIGKLQITAVSAFHVDICFAGVPFQKNNGLATCTLSYDASLPTELIVDAFAFDWSATMNLLRITRRFNAFLESQLTPGGLKYDVEYNMKSLKIFYGPELELAMFISWDRSNHKMLMDFYCRTGNAWNPHRQMRTKLLELLTSEQSHEMHLVEFAKIFEIIGNTTPLVLGVRDSIRPVGVVKDPRLLHPQTAFQFLPVSLSNYVVSWKGTYYVYIRVLAGPKFILTDLGGTEIVRKSDDVKYMPIPGFRILLEEVTGQRFPKWKTEMGYGNVTLEESIGGLDPEVQYSLVRFFTRFKGYHVQLTGASYGI